VLPRICEQYDGAHPDFYTQRKQHVRGSYQARSSVLLTSTLSLIPLMVARLLLSLRKTSDSATVHGPFHPSPDIQHRNHGRGLPYFFRYSQFSRRAHVAIRGFGFSGGAVGFRPPG